MSHLQPRTQAQLLLLLMLTMKTTTSPDTAQHPVRCEQYSLINGVCFDAANTLPAGVDAIGCGLICGIHGDSCIACTQLSADAAIYRQLQMLPNGSLAAPAVPGNCTTMVKKAKVNELMAAACPLSQNLSQVAFLVELKDTRDIGTRNLGDLLCSQWCQEVVKDATRFVSVGAAPPGKSGRCAPLTTSGYFASVGGGGFNGASALAASLGWREAFSDEAWCTHNDVTNVPPLVLATWSTPHQLDVCAQACVWRAGCEFFVFNATGCYEGSLSLYLKCRRIGVTGCSIRHKVRSWASSMLAFYTFNSSMLNLANPAVMPAVNNSPVDVGPDGFLVPLTVLQHVRLNLSQIGFDSLVRGGTQFTFLVSFTRTNLKPRSELALFASCSDSSLYNGAINEQSVGNVGWFLNSLTGKWQQADSTVNNSTITYPNGPVINMALAIGANTCYFIVNGIMLDTTCSDAVSTYGTSPDLIGCLYLGFNYIAPPSKFLHGRIKLFAIFAKMLTVGEVGEIL